MEGRELLHRKQQGIPMGQEGAALSHEERARDEDSNLSKERPSLPNFVRAQLLLIKNSKKLTDYPFPEDIVADVESIVGSMEEHANYGKAFRKVHFFQKKDVWHQIILLLILGVETTSGRAE